MTRAIACFLTPGTAQIKTSEPRCLTHPAITLLTILCLLLAMMTSQVLAVLPFPRPSPIEPNVKFWIDVFATYSERDFIIHDRDHVWRIFQVLQVPGDGPPSRSDIDAVNDYLKSKFSNILSRLASGQAPADYEERQVAALFKDEPLSEYVVAAQNLRVQQGMREQFRESLLRSRYYRSTMERIFSDAGLPPELVALAEVEAKLLRSNFLTFGSWPLAITAYDYGTAGTAQAAEQYAGDYARIVRNYDGPHFGFASKNYYAEFLAALQIDQFEEAYFPDIRYDEAPPPPPVRTDFAPSRITHRRLLRHAAYHHRHRLHRHRRVVAALSTTAEAIE